MIVSSKKCDDPPGLSEAVGVLGAKGWLSSRPEKSRDLILSCGRMRRYGAGEAIYHIGDKAEGMYGLVRGSVAISIPNDAGSAFVATQATQGFWIGDLALFADSKRLVSVSALVPCDVLFLQQAKLEELLQQHPELIADFYALSHQNTATALRLLANLAIAQSDKRLAAWLLNADRNLGAADNWITLTQEQIAMMVAMSLPTLQRLVKKFSHQNLLEVRYGRLRVCDREGLARFAEA